MGILGWLEKKGIEKGRANLQQTVEKLIRAADASWAQTEQAMQSGLPIPPADPKVMEYQKELLSDLSTWKGSLPDKEAVDLIGTVMRTSKAGRGGQMALRFVVIDQWPKHGKPTIATAEMELYLGSRAADEGLVASVQAYVVETVKGQKAPAPSEAQPRQLQEDRGEGLSGKPFTQALLARAESETEEAKKWIRDTLGSVRETRRPATLEGRVEAAIGTMALGITMNAAERANVKPLLPGEAPTKQTSIVAAFGLVVVASLGGLVKGEGLKFDEKAPAAVFFSALYMLHSPEVQSTLVSRDLTVFRELASVDIPSVREWWEQMGTVATSYVLQTSSSNPKLRDLDMDYVASEMLRTVLRAAE